MTGAWLFMLKCIYVIYVHLCVNWERQWSPVVRGVESVVRLPALRSWLCPFDTCKLREVPEPPVPGTPPLQLGGAIALLTRVYEVKWPLCSEHQWVFVAVNSVCGHFCLFLIFHNNNKQPPQKSFRKKAKLPCLPQIVWHNHFARCTGTDGAAMKDYLFKFDCFFLLLSF